MPASPFQGVCDHHAQVEAAAAAVAASLQLGAGLVPEADEDRHCGGGWRQRSGLGRQQMQAKKRQKEQQCRQRPPVPAPEQEAQQGLLPRRVGEERCQAGGPLPQQGKKSPLAIEPWVMLLDINFFFIVFFSLCALYLWVLPLESGWVCSAPLSSVLERGPMPHGLCAKARPATPCPGVLPGPLASPTRAHAARSLCKGQAVPRRLAGRGLTSPTKRRGERRRWHCPLWLLQGVVQRPLPKTRRRWAAALRRTTALFEFIRWRHLTVLKNCQIIGLSISPGTSPLSTFLSDFSLQNVGVVIYHLLCASLRS